MLIFVDTVLSAEVLDDAGEAVDRLDADGVLDLFDVNPDF